jgi:hypothetical protein
MPQTNLIDKPPEMRNAAKEGFGTAGVLLNNHIDHPFF